jgi:hypothetical protein
MGPNPCCYIAELRVCYCWNWALLLLELVFATAGICFCYWLDLDGASGWIWTLLMTISEITVDLIGKF